jgi:hypothetical protein
MYLEIWLFASYNDALGERTLGAIIEARTDWIVCLSILKICANFHPPNSFCNGICIVMMNIFICRIMKNETVFKVLTVHMLLLV